MKSSGFLAYWFWLFSTSAQGGVNDLSVTSGLDLDVLLGRDLYPFLDFFLDGRGQHFRRAAGRIDAQLVEAVLDTNGDQRLVQVAIEQFDDRPRRTGRSEQAEPGEGFVVWNARFRDRRLVRKEAPSLAAADGQKFDGAGPNERQRRRTVHGVVNSPGDEIGHRRRRTAIWNMIGPDAGHRLKQLDRQMIDAAGTERAIGQLARSCARELDQIADRGDVERGRGDEQQRRGRNQPDRDEILDRVVRQFWIDRDIGAVGARRAYEQGVPVGSGLRRPGRADRTAGPDHVLANNGLTEAFAELLADGACDDVCAASGWERHNDLDASLRKVLAKHQRGAQRHESRRQRNVTNPTCREDCFHPEHL